MPGYIDNITILKAIDEHQRQQGGRPYWMSAQHLLNEISGTYAADLQVVPGFLQELLVAKAAGHLTWRLTDQTSRFQDPNYYLQQIQELALTSDGQDRARGWMIERQLPSPEEDDGHELSDLILQQVAEIITSEYAADQRVTFLAEEDLPPEWLSLPDGTAPDDVHAVLATTWRAASLGRDLVRRFLGRWLDERLLTGPDAEQRATLTGQLLRQGWRIRDSDSVLVATEPVRGVPVPAPPMHYWHPHPLVEAAARPQFLHRQLDQAVFAAMKAVEIRVRQLADLGDNLIGVDLMNKAFSSGGPLAPPPQPSGKHDDGPRSLFSGAISMFRNPAGHLQVGYTDAEAVEAVALASALMRHLDHVEVRMLTAARQTSGG
jgi:uncharacterized protein (TIGR02391 family)